MGSLMQFEAAAALASGIVMVLGVSVTLFLKRRAQPGGAVNRWHRHGTIPLVAAALALGVISRSGVQSPATHDILFAEVTTLLLAALLCALAGATAATRQRR
jgi:hypothetical protein